MRYPLLLVCHRPHPSSRHRTSPVPLLCSAAALAAFFFLSTLDCLLQLVEFLLVLNAHWSQSAVCLSPSSQSSMVARSYKTCKFLERRTLASRSDAVGPFLGPVDHKSLGQYFPCALYRTVPRSVASMKKITSRDQDGTQCCHCRYTHRKNPQSTHRGNEKLVTWEMSPKLRLKPQRPLQSQCLGASSSLLPPSRTAREHHHPTQSFESSIGCGGLAGGRRCRVLPGRR